MASLTVQHGLHLGLGFNSGSTWTNAYESGAFSVIPISFREDDHGCVFTIGQRAGEFNGMIAKRKINIRYHMPDRVLDIPMDYSGNFLYYNLVLR